MFGKLLESYLRSTAISGSIKIEIRYKLNSTLGIIIIKVISKPYLILNERSKKQLIYWFASKV
ncbi:hypothetical protein CHRY9393_00730 [Chryseobacterium fistulae]|uniref:Uncharacterized protein n=1 Tax=Chryseobacterium fistulae TaxID=2675058 RepID=A0A6N4XPC3_9FLAO|nr:hypothetical protein CHRY9393_00730 [Chryseobacterium fistulae]